MKGQQQVLLPDKGKPSARTGRKATGLSELAGLPKESCRARHVGSTEPHLTRSPAIRHGGRRHAHKILTRILPAAAVAAGLLFASPAPRTPRRARRRTSRSIAKIALGDKRRQGQGASRGEEAEGQGQGDRRLPEHRRSCRRRQPRARPRRAAVPAQPDPREATACRCSRTTRSCARPPPATRTTWSPRATSTTPARTATRSSTASSTPATPSATTAGRSARTWPGARAS